MTGGSGGRSTCSKGPVTFKLLYEVTRYGDVRVDGRVRCGVSPGLDAPNLAVIHVIMFETRSVPDVKAHLSELVAQVGTQHDRVTITVHGANSQRDDAHDWVSEALPTNAAAVS